MSQAPTPARTFYSNLEVARFAGAFAVLVWHFQHFLYDGLEQQTYHPADHPLYWMLKPFYTYGYFGVEFFWMLSGFIMFANYSDSLQTGKVSPQEFAVLRFSRLYPLHIVTAILVFGLQALYRAAHEGGQSFVYARNSLLDLLLNATMTSNWLPRQGFSLNGPFWSVSVETFVYCAFFVLARYLPRWLTNLAFVAAIGTLAVRPLAVPFPYILLGLDLFFVGGLLFRVSRWSESLDARLKRALLGAASMSTAALLAVSSLLHNPTMAGGTVLYGLFGVAILALAMAPQLSGSAARIASLLGNTTYSSYLIHFPITLALATTFAASGRALPPGARSSYLDGSQLYTYSQFPRSTGLNAQRKDSFGADLVSRPPQNESTRLTFLT